MFTVGPRIMSRPSGLHFLTNRLPSLCTRSVSQVAAMATPAGKAVVVTVFLATSALVSEEGPAHDLYAERTIRHFYRGNAKPFIGDALHPVGATQHGNFFLQRHAAQQVLNALLDRQTGIFVRRGRRAAGVLRNPVFRHDGN